MAKKKKIINLLIAICVGILAWIILSNIFKCAVYYNLCAAKPMIKDALSLKPLNVNLPSSKDIKGISLAYAQTNIKSESIKQIKLYENTLIIEGNECTFCFMPPDNQTGFDAININDIKLERLSFENAKFLKDLKEDFFTAQVKVINTMPKKYSEIYWMSKEDFSVYFQLAFMKSMTCNNAHGIEIIETENIKGIIFLGSKNSPTNLRAEIFSKGSNKPGITQCIHVISPSLEKNKNVLYSLLSTYRFLITKTPQKDELSKLLISEFKNNDKFIDETTNNAESN
jgi:hypothetical protein